MHAREPCVCAGADDHHSVVAFQLFSHKHMFVDGNVDPNDPTVRDGRAIPLIKRHRAWKPAKSVAKDRQVEEAANEEEEEELPELNKWVALALLVVVTVLVAGMSSWTQGSDRRWSDSSDPFAVAQSPPSFWCPASTALRSNTQRSAPNGSD